MQGFAAQLKDELTKIRALSSHVDISNRDVFLRNMVFLYNTIRASENLLTIAVDLTIPGTGLHQYLVDHLAEEHDHDKWLAADLLTVGIDVTQTEIQKEAVQLVGTAYYMMYHVDPACILGFLATMEFFPASLDDITKLEELHGKDVCRTARFHAEADVGHADELAEALDELSDKQQENAFKCAIETALYLSAAFCRLQ